MKYLMLYMIGPAAVSFLVQSILCRKVKKGILRHGALFFPIISAAMGIYLLLTQCGSVFGGLGAIAAVLWFGTGCCTGLGYGAAWWLFHMAKKGKDGKQEERGRV